MQTSDTPAASVATAALALDGEGLRIFKLLGGSSSLLPFGQAKVDTLTTLTTLRGAPKTQAENIDCGATNAVWADGLTGWFARDKFAGWSVGSSASGTASTALATAGGLRLGATRTEVEQGASVARIAHSTLGEEFNAGGIAGLLDASDPDARVSHLWAGAACVAR